MRETTRCRAARAFAVLALLAAGGPAAAEEPTAAGDAALAACRDAAARQSLDEAAELAERAREAYETVLDADPAAVEARVGIAKALMECRIESAPMMEKVALLQAIEEQLGRALASAPEHWEARFLYGALLYNVPPFLGRSDEAVEHLETLLEQERRAGAHRSPEPFLILGELYLRREEPERACEVWRRGLAAFPGYQPLAERLDRLDAEGEAAGDGTVGAVAGDASERADPAEPGQSGEPAHPPQRTGAAGSVKPAARPAIVDRLRRRLEREVERPEVPGIAAAVIRGDDVLLIDGFGLADLENRVPVTPRTVFRLGSVSKQLTAAAVLALAEEGRLGLGDEVAHWLPEAGAGARGIRLHHLLSHTAGLPLDTAGAAGWLAESLAAPRLGEPGERYGYSNAGYGIAGLAVERAAGMPLPAYLRQRFFEPLGMAATRPCDPVTIIPWRAEGYSWVGNTLTNDGPLEASPTLQAAGGLCSSLEDLVTWSRALHGGRLLDPASYRRMTTPAPVAAGTTTYGFGLRIDAPRGRRVIHHSGGITGFLSELAFYPGEELTVAVLTNSEASSPRELGYELAEIVLGPSPSAAESGC